MATYTHSMAYGKFKRNCVCRLQYIYGNFSSPVYFFFLNIHIQLTWWMLISINFILFFVYTDLRLSRCTKLVMSSHYRQVNYSPTFWGKGEFRVYSPGNDLRINYQRKPVLRSPPREVGDWRTLQYHPSWVGGTQRSNVFYGWVHPHPLQRRPRGPRGSISCHAFCTYSDRVELQLPTPPVQHYQLWWKLLPHRQGI